MNAVTPAQQRVWRLVCAARRIADGRDPLGHQARRRLRQQLGLSHQAIELGIHLGLETQPTRTDVATLCANVAPAPRAWVVLSANVFVAAHRAIALGLAASAQVYVKASRRDPVLAELLHEAEPALFTLVEQIAPAAGDHVYAYGRASTLAALRETLPPGVSWHAHGPGLGVAVVGGGDWRVAAEAIALDAVVFEQRGCLSPRLVGLTPQVPLEPFCAHLAEALRGFGARVPAPHPTGDERAQRTWFEQVAAYAGVLHPAGPGVVFGYEAPPADEASARHEPFIPLPPPSRSLTVFAAAEPLRAMHQLRPWVTTVATEVAAEPEARRWFPAARHCRYGEMQRPPFDGPVDARPAPHGEAT